MNTQMQIRNIIIIISSAPMAPVLHPTSAPTPISAISSGDFGVKLITIIDLQSKVTDLATF